MKKQAIFFTSLLFCFAVSAQCDFQWQNPFPQGNDLEEVQFVNEQTGWAVGLAGTVLKTTNGGVTWEISYVSGKEWLFGLHFVNESIGYVAGSNGAIYKSTDGGAIWAPQNSGTDKILYDVQFSDGNNGWAVGEEGVILATADSGANWVPQNIGQTDDLKGLFVLDADNIWAVSDDGAILKSSDSGQSWNVQKDGSGFALADVFFLDSQRGWACGQGIIYRTIDGGESWSLSLPSTTLVINKVHFPDANNGWACASTGSIFRSVDGGAHWTKIFLDIDERSLRGMSFATPQKAWMVGLSGTMYHTQNSGQNWEKYSVGETSYLNSTFFLDEQTGWAAGWWDLTLKTIDGGTTWQTMYKNYNSNRLILDLWFNNASEGWATTGSLNNPSGSGSLLKTTDGGASWQAQITSTSRLWDIDFKSSERGWAVGNNGVGWRTTDGGVSWSLMPFNGNTGNWRDVCFADENTGWVAGDGGRIWRSTNGGVSWSAQTTPTTWDISALSFIDSQTGWAAGEWGMVLHTTDGGQSWSVQPTGTLVNFTKLHFTDAHIGFAFGGGSLYYTNDGGANWTKIIAPGGNLNYSIDFAEGQTAYLVGNSGSIAKMICNIAVPVTEPLYSSALSVQIFPNPTADGYVSVVFDEPFEGQVSVISSTGQLLHSEIVERQSAFLLGLGGLPMGVYVLSFLEENGPCTFRKLVRM